MDFAQKSLYRFIFFDADGTLLDFDKCEYTALGKTFETLGLPYDADIHAVFNAVNKSLWRAYDEGKTTREKLLLDRFIIVAEKLNLPKIDASKAEKIYRQNLNETHYVYDGVFALLDYLKPRYKLFIVTNGVKATQDRRLAESGLTPYFKDIFISDALGVNKPHKEFFDKAFATIKDFDKSRALVVGDSLTGDMAGAKNAGVDACFINRDGVKNDKNIPIKYEFSTLDGLYDIL